MELVRVQRESGHALVRGVARAATGAYRGIGEARAILTDADRRAVALLKLLRPRDVHQTTKLTWRDRYPDIFARCAQALETQEGLHLLSYGCSTGEEVLTLRDYFPQARITGAEINSRSLATCRRLAVDNRIILSSRRQTPFEPAARTTRSSAHLPRQLHRGTGAQDGGARLVSSKVPVLVAAEAPDLAFGGNSAGHGIAGGNLGERGRRGGVAGPLPASPPPQAVRVSNRP